MKQSEKAPRGSRRVAHSIVLSMTILALSGSGNAAGAFAGNVVSFVPGNGAGFGSAYFPANVLGPPNGNADPNTPNFSETDLVSLGDGGVIVLEFPGYAITDGPGADFTVFENALVPIGQPDQVFADTAVISVSNNGTNWTTFPFDFIPPAPAGSLMDKANYVGFAGVAPVYSSTTNGIPAFEPTVSGGDQFDLADVGLAQAKFVRITDTGTTGPTQTMDTDGDIVTDSGALITFGGSMGFDLDAVAALNTTAVSAVRNEYWLYE